MNRIVLMPRPRLRNLLFALPLVLGLGLGALLMVEPVSPLRDGLPILAGRPLTDEGLSLRPLRDVLRGVRAAVAAVTREVRLTTSGEVRRSWLHETNAVTLQITSVLTPELRAATRALVGTHLGSIVPISDDAVAVVTRAGDVFIFDAATLQIRSRLHVPDIVVSQGPATGLRDVALLTQTSSTLTLVASYGWTESAPRSCLRAGLLTFTLERNATLASKPIRLWATAECVPFSMVYGSTFGGRVLVTSDRLFLALGDVGAPHPPDSLFDTLLAFPLSAGAVLTAAPVIISRGFRNPAGLAAAAGSIYVAAQGPKGGDSLVRAVTGADFGWPRVSHGEEYAFSGFPPPHTSSPTVTLPHYVWVPSPAVSALDVNRTGRLDRWFNEDGLGNLLVTSLKGRALYRCALSSAGQVVFCETIVIGERLRDVVSTSAAVFLLADSGYLYRVTPE